MRRIVVSLWRRSTTAASSRVTIFSGDADVVVTDGSPGTHEDERRSGAAHPSLMREEFSRSPRRKAGAVAAR